MRQLEAELAATLKQVELLPLPVKSERYQVYFRKDFELLAKALMAQGLDNFLLVHSSSNYGDRFCTFTVLQPAASHNNWGALRLDITYVKRASLLLKLRSVMKPLFTGVNPDQLRSTLPKARSTLYRD